MSCIPQVLLPITANVAWAFQPANCLTLYINALSQTQDYTLFACHSCIRQLRRHAWKDIGTSITLAGLQSSACLPANACGVLRLCAEISRHVDVAFGFLAPQGQLRGSP